MEQPNQPSSMFIKCTVKQLNTTKKKKKIEENKNATGKNLLNPSINVYLGVSFFFYSITGKMVVCYSFNDVKSFSIQKRQTRWVEIGNKLFCNFFFFFVLFLPLCFGFFTFYLTFWIYTRMMWMGSMIVTHHRHYHCHHWKLCWYFI